MSKSGIVNVRMVITEEKIISNIDKVQKLINPKNKKQIIQLEEDTYFKDLIESIKSYLIEYPNKKNFPSSVYNAAYGLVEFAINLFEENTKKVEKLIKQREANIALAGVLEDIVSSVDGKKEGYKQKIEEAEGKFSEDVVEALNTVARCKTKTSQKYNDSMKILKARINNLESNLHIEIDMERLEDSSKALSYIAIEISDALKQIPTPQEKVQKVELEENEDTTIQDVAITELAPIAKKAKVRFKKKKAVPVAAIEPIVEEVNNIETAVETTNEQVITNNIVDLANATNNIVENVEENNIQQAQKQYEEQTRFETKPSLWQRFKNSKFVWAATYIFRIRIRIELPNALPEGRGENS